MTAEGVETLRDRGLRVTAQRLAVLSALGVGSHLTAEAVAERARADLGSVSLQAVYDALGALAEAGLVRRIQPAGSPALFEARAGDNHHHVLCRGCGSIGDVDCAIGHTPCLTAADDLGYHIDEAEVIYHGYCPSCLKERASNSNA